MPNRNNDFSPEEDFKKIEPAPEKKIAHPVAPWRQGSYEHVKGEDFPDLFEKPKYVQLLEEKFPKSFLGFSGYRGDPHVLFRSDDIVKAITLLRDDDDSRFDLLRDLFAVDNLKNPERWQPFQKAGLNESMRYEVVYILYSLRFRHELVLRVPLPEKEPAIDSILHLYKSANWHEREAWDMMGIHFNGHPKLKRLLNHVEFEGHPLRKDYPINRRHNIRKPLMDL